MPQNRFPDSAEKREFRRRDGRLIKQFREKNGFPLGLSYCGMPSVEFLDVLAWKDDLRSVKALEYDASTYQDMLIQWSSLDMHIECQVILENIYAYLGKATETFDLYNLDFFGGFLNSKIDGGSNSTDAIRALINRQSAKKQSFVLIATFNVRENAVKAYDQLIDAIPAALVGWGNVKENCDAHRKKAYFKTKLGYPYFCLEIGRTNNFLVNFSDIFLYQSSVPLLHFYAEFEYAPSALPSLPTTQSLADLANLPLKKLDGLVPKVIFQPPAIATGK